MNEEQLINAAFSLIGLMGAGVLFFWLYRWYRIDTFRQEMFYLRDALFDDAMKGLIPFSHPAYRELRVAMNGYIRFAHTLSVPQLLLLLWLQSSTPQLERETLNMVLTRALKSLDSQTKARLDEYQQKMHQLVVAQILLAPETIIFLGALLIPILTVVAFAITKQTLESQWKAFKQPRLDALDDSMWASGC